MSVHKRPPIPTGTEIVQWDDDVRGLGNGERALSAKVVDRRTLVLAELLWDGLSGSWKSIRTVELDADAFARLLAVARDEGLPIKQV